ncbi:MAG: hypothetical protein IVW55_12195 [Chloroflexi bacterium]|nr:hypothetical protein [Chloroflexota bacterium]
MRGANTILFYGFAVSVLLIIAVYFIGLSTDAGAAATSMRALIYSLTGRDTSGKFADYPGGAVGASGADLAGV